MTEVQQTLLGAGLCALPGLAILRADRRPALSLRSHSFLMQHGSSPASL